MDRKNIPTIFVIFGATGDLMTKKITPALFHLYEKGLLPKMFKVIGFARRPLKDSDFQKNIIEILKLHGDWKDNKEKVKKFLTFFSYWQGDFGDLTDYKNLAKKLGRIDDEWKVCANKLFYLAVPPQYYETIFNHLKTSGLTIPCGPDEGWTRVLVEKPFGKDAKTADRLEKVLSKLFKEEQIYRIDHYLAKEMLQNILVFRFSNNLLEEAWSNKLIEKIEIRILESIGVEGRGPFYEGLGALRDVGQNHLLQILALITMDRPPEFTADTIRFKRSQILSTLKNPTPQEIKQTTFRAQYKGYRDIKGVSKNSQTETYFKVKAYLDSPRWQGVPIFLESGKRFTKAIKEVEITFRHKTPCLCPPGGHYQNRIIFSMEPKEEIKIYFISRKPGFARQVQMRSLNFLYRKKLKGTQYVEEYEKLLLDCIDGNQMLFLSTDEVRSMWNFIDPIFSAWQKNQINLNFYKPDTDEALKEARVVGEVEPAVSIIGHRKEIGIVGLGKMGANVAKQLVEKGWTVYGHNRTPSVTKNLEGENVRGVYSLSEFSKKLKPPRILWLMVPAGKPVDEMIEKLIPYFSKGDILIDAGNSFYKDTVRRSKKLEEKGIKFVDIGVSGGPSGARYGASLMVGGEKTSYEILLPLLTDIAVPEGFAFFEGAGAGHFVKMIHNGIEYGMMQAIAEGFGILKKAKYSLDLKNIADVYNHGSVIESRLMGWLKRAFELHGDNLKDISGKVAHTGEGEWTIKTADELGIKAKIIEEALQFRKNSEERPSYIGKILSALRNQFGGHATK